MRLQLGTDAAAAALVLVPGLFGSGVRSADEPVVDPDARRRLARWFAFLAVVGATVFHQFDVRRPVPPTPDWPGWR